MGIEAVIKVGDTVGYLVGAMEGVLMVLVKVGSGDGVFPQRTTAGSGQV